MKGSQTVQVLDNAGGGSGGGGGGGIALLSPGYAEQRRARQQMKSTQQELLAGSLYIMDDELDSIAEQNPQLLVGTGATTTTPAADKDETIIMALLEMVSPEGGTVEVMASRKTLDNMPPPPTPK